jgi:hypothetical protein
VVTSGNNTVTLTQPDNSTTLNDGTYSNCTIRVTDSAGNASSNLSVSSFTIGAIKPALVEVTLVPTPTNDNTSSYTFFSTLSGTISYGGSCSSSTTSAVAGNNTITFNALADGTYDSCTISVTSSSNVMSDNLSVSSFTIDITAPTLSQVTAVTSPTNDTMPSYTFSSNEAGTISYGGSCKVDWVTSTYTGSLTIRFNTLSEGSYSNCTITVTDSAGNASSALSVNTFVVDTTAPTLSQATAVTSPTNDTTPDYTFSSTEAGTITYGGSCSSSTTSVTTDNNTITLVSLSNGTYSDCTITVTDSAGNTSSSLAITSFTVNTATAVFGTSLFNSSYLGD